MDARRRTLVKVLMPENTSSIPLDDEDILDLTVVAEPGKKMPVASPTAAQPQTGDAGGSDFGADLDALLDSLSSSPSQTAAPVKAATESPIAAPIADQTPADHIVDPHEEIAMPEMSDIDSLLAELGADVAMKVQPSSSQPTEEPLQHQAPLGPGAPLPEFNAILAQAQAAEQQKAEEEQAAPPQPDEAPAATPSAESVLETPGQLAEAEIPAPTREHPAKQQPAASSANTSDATSPMEPSPAPSAATQPATPHAPAPSAATQPATPHVPAADHPEKTPVNGNETSSHVHAAEQTPAPEPHPEDASLDLNELDALLDDILSSAPKTEGIPAPDAGSRDFAEALPVPEHALLPADGMKPLADRIAKLEEALDLLESERAQTISETMIENLIDTKIAALLKPDSPVLQKLIEGVVHNLTQEGPKTEVFSQTLEKMAAAAAAKVIREEIASMISEE